MRQAVRYPTEPARWLARLWHRLEWVLLPFWLGVPLTYLGFAFVLSYPAQALFPDASWELYAFPLVVAGVLAVAMRWLYRTTVLDRSDDGVVVAFHRASKPARHSTR